MKRANTVLLILEIVVILGNIVIGTTALTYIMQHVTIDKEVIGSLILAVGVIEFSEFFTLKYIDKRRNIPNALIAILSIALGFVFILSNFDLDLVCILWGAIGGGFYLIKVLMSIINISRQPLLNGTRTILCTTQLVFCILLIVNKQDFIMRQMLVFSISLLVLATVLTIELLIHRYQRV